MRPRGRGGPAADGRAVFGEHIVLEDSELEILGERFGRRDLGSGRFRAVPAEVRAELGGFGGEAPDAARLVPTRDEVFIRITASMAEISAADGADRGESAPADLRAADRSDRMRQDDDGEDLLSPGERAVRGTDVQRRYNAGGFLSADRGRTGRLRGSRRWRRWVRRCRRCCTGTSC